MATTSDWFENNSKRVTETITYGCPTPSFSAGGLFGLQSQLNFGSYGLDDYIERGLATQITFPSSNINNDECLSATDIRRITAEHTACLFNVSTIKRDRIQDCAFVTGCGFSLLSLEFGLDFGNNHAQCIQNVEAFNESNMLFCDRQRDFALAETDHCAD